MKVRLILGPAGSGKTFRCLAEVRRELLESQEGLPLLFLAPKQTTYQLERQLLSDPALPGYTRLHILNFERMAHLVLQRMGGATPKMLEEEGRLMVLRALLAKERGELKLFRASSRLTGFAQQLSLVLHELQRNRLTPDSLRQLAQQVREPEGLNYKLEDLATLLNEYLAWLENHGLKDSGSLLETAAKALTDAAGQKPVAFEALWVDGFAEFSPQELELLSALMECCSRATITFCLDRSAIAKKAWLSNWSVVRRAFESCRERFSSLGAEVCVEDLFRDPLKTRFCSPVLGHLEEHWDQPQPYLEPTNDPTGSAPGGQRVADVLRIATCRNPDAEATLAAREILRHVRNGGRYREVTVLVRNLDLYHQPLERAFIQYEIPFFLDRRESISHHPLAELTRSAIRTIAFQWPHDDWFTALKTGLVPAPEDEVDRLENEALARGWKGGVWQKPIVVPEEPELSKWLAGIHHRVLPPFQRLALALEKRRRQPNGAELGAALRQLWHSLNVEEKVADWAAAEVDPHGLQNLNPVHSTVWTQINSWLENIELAFGNESLPLREWLPILEAGLANLTVGVIPPALDQVLVGAIDRSRNPDIKLAFVLGMNESVFPAPLNSATLLTEADRAELEKRDVLVSTSTRQQLARERYLAYVACTRARERIVLTRSLQDSEGVPLNPSPFLSHIEQLIPSVEEQVEGTERDLLESEHTSELLGPVARLMGGGPGDNSEQVESDEPWLSRNLHAPNELDTAIRTLPGLALLLDELRRIPRVDLRASLPHELAARLYGPVLRTSVSRMEQFAACPFKFFVHSGLRAQERKQFVLDLREQGSFQHDALQLFHQALRRENKRWRDITPAEARKRIATVCTDLMVGYREGLLQASNETRFLARVLTESLQDFLETLVAWIRSQYLFEPEAVELAFGEEGAAPPWAISLAPGRRLEIRGRIDRIDLVRREDEGLCVVIDYKSSPKQLEERFVANGLQLQLLTYLNVLRQWPGPRETFGVARLVPAGVFYVNLRGKYDHADNRREALDEAAAARRMAYQHTGRFDARFLRLLDAREDAIQGDQFKYRLTKSGALNKAGRQGLETAEFNALLDSVEGSLKRMAQEIVGGVAAVDPFRAGATTACLQCQYQAICRIDPWTHSYRSLKKPANKSELK